ncbi:MAG: hypothetical protein C5B51_29745 [Terriglobia bacterium]|nr:MAG: hypothetical protein C5B51_29745 [Terriglobia bacterium]
MAGAGGRAAWRQVHHAFRHYRHRRVLRTARGPPTALRIPARRQVAAARIAGLEGMGCSGFRGLQSRATQPYRGIRRRTPLGNSFLLLRTRAGAERQESIFGVNWSYISIVKPAPESCEPELPRHGSLFYAGRVALLGTCACTLILVSFQPSFRLSDIFQKFTLSLVYSCSIVFPAALLLIRMGRESLASGRVVGLVPRVFVLMGANVAGCLFAGIVLILLGFYPAARYWAEFRFSILFSTVFTLVIGLSVSLYREMQVRLERATLELRTRQMEEERARKLAAEARLSSLESRIHPHFLFNTLNSISALIPKDPKRAEEMVGKLASLLRFSLNANQTGLVPLGQELQTVRDYLEIEKARFDTRLRYSIDVPEDAESIGVPPLSVESLVENCVKHVIARRPEGGEIRVRASLDGDCLALEVSDDGPGFSLDRIPAGHGLDNLAGRLALLFGGEARLEAVRNGRYASVRVTLPRNV